MNKVWVALYHGAKWLAIAVWTIIAALVISGAVLVVYKVLDYLVRAVML